MSSKDLIVKYYQAFNHQDMQTFSNLLSQNIRHDINQGIPEFGKDKFQAFMERMNQCYKETVKDLVIFISDDGRRAAAEFTIEGKYLKTDPGLPEASGQTYTLAGGAFFDIENNNKISRVTMYYNLQDWLKQVSA